MPQEAVEPLSDNAALNAIVDELEIIETELTEDYDYVYGASNFVAVSDSQTQTRDADPQARKTVVCNKGPDTVRVREDNVFVLLIPAGESRALPLNGKGQIKVNCDTGDASQIAISTYVKLETE